MAEARLIEAYLTELRYSVATLDDADDIVDEAADHLACALDAGLSEEEALARFGSAQLVAKVFAEEAKRGGAVSTTLTRRAGVAAMATVPLIVVGQSGNVLTSRGIVHGAFVFMEALAFAAFCIALWGIRRRHGGLGRSGRIAFWLFVAAPFTSAPFLYAAPLVWAFEMLIVIALLGSAMLDAAVLPRIPVAMFTFTPFLALVIIPGMSAIGLDAGPWFLTLFAPIGIGVVWVGYVMWREPALDERVGSFIGPSDGAAMTT